MNRAHFVVLVLIFLAAMAVAVPAHKRVLDKARITPKILSKTSSVDANATVASQFNQNMQATVVQKGYDKEGNKAEVTHVVTAKLQLSQAQRAQVHAAVLQAKSHMSASQDLINRSLRSEDPERVELAERVVAEQKKCQQLHEEMIAHPDDDELSAECHKQHAKAQALTKQLSAMDTEANGHSQAQAMKMQGGQRVMQIRKEQLGAGSLTMTDKTTIAVDGHDDVTHQASLKVSAGVHDVTQLHMAQGQVAAGAVGKSHTHTHTHTDTDAEEGSSEGQMNQAEFAGKGGAAQSVSVSHSRVVYVNGRAMRSSEKGDPNQSFKHAFERAAQEAQAKGDLTQSPVHDTKVRKQVVQQAYRARHQAADRHASMAAAAEGDKESAKQAKREKAEQEAAARAKFRAMVVAAIKRRQAAEQAHRQAEQAKSVHDAEARIAREDNARQAAVAEAHHPRHHHDEDTDESEDRV